MKAGLYIVGILLCALVAAFLSGTETGLLSLSHARLMHLVRAGVKSARILHGYLGDLQRCLASLLVGHNLVNVILSTLSASLAQSCFPSNSGAQTLWAVVMAFLVLFFCEFLPKLFFTTRPLRRTLLVARPFYVMDRLLTPLTNTILFLTRWLVPQSDSGTGQRFLMTREYIQNVVSDAKHGSRISAFERLMINRVLTLHTQTAAQIMTPLSRVVRTCETAPLRDCFQTVRDSGHVRLPVFNEDGTRCVGVLNVAKTLASNPDPDVLLARDSMEKPFFVSADERADDVLPLMRKHRHPLALVSERDSGAVLGIITEEDVIFALTASL